MKNYTDLFKEFSRIQQTVLEDSERRGLKSVLVGSEYPYPVIVDSRYYQDEINRLKAIQNQTSYPEEALSYIFKKCAEIGHITINNQDLVCACHVDLYERHPIDMFQDIFFRHFSDDEISFQKPSPEFFYEPNMPPAINFTGPPSQTDFKDTGLAIQPHLFFEWEFSDQMGLIAHEWLHNILMQAVLYFRDGEMPPDHPLYKLAQIKHDKEEHKAIPKPRLWDIYKDDPEELLCYEVQDYFENIMKPRSLPKPD